MDSVAPAVHSIKLKESEKEDKYRDLAREFFKKWNTKVTIIPIETDAFGTVIKGLLKGLGNKRTDEDHPNFYIIENCQNTEKSPGDLRKLVVTQTPVNDHLLTLM